MVAYQVTSISGIVAISATGGPSAGDDRIMPAVKWLIAYHVDHRDELMLSLDEMGLVRIRDRLGKFYNMSCYSPSSWSAISVVDLSYTAREMMNKHDYIVQIKIGEDDDYNVVWSRG